MTLRAVTFDVDGTLFDLRQMKIVFAITALRHARFLRAFLKAREEVRALGQVADVRREQDERVAKAIGITVEKAAATRRKVIDEDWVAAFAKVKPIPGVREALAELAKRGFKLGTVSDYEAAPKLAKMKLDHVRWDADVGAEPLNALKPHPLSFRTAVERLGVAAGETLHIGDRLDADVAGAHAAGMRAALFTAGNARKYDAPPGARAPEFTFDDYARLLEHV